MVNYGATHLYTYSLSLSLQMHEKEYRQSIAENRLTDDIKFVYAWHLIKSKYKKDITKGIKLMEGTC